MKKILLLITVALIQNITLGQTHQNNRGKTSTVVYPNDIRKLSTMTEKEIEHYKINLIEQAKKNIHSLDPHLLKEMQNGNVIKIPTKNSRQITKAEALKIDKETLLNFISKLKVALLPLIPETIKKEIQKDSMPGNLEENSIITWYNNRPEVSLLLSISAVEKDPENRLYWNNLGALCNLSKLYAQAIPILKYALTKSPKSSLIMNNLGQAYLGLGDVKLSEKYLEICVKIDSLNPEANRSLAILNLYRGQNDKAIQYFSNQFQVAYRKTDLSIIRNSGLEEFINFAEIFKKGNARLFHLDENEGTDEVLNTIFEDHIDNYAKGPNIKIERSLPFNFERYISKQKNHKATFAGLHLNKFELPPFPKSVESADILVPAHREFQRNTYAEIDFWLRRIALNANEKLVVQNQTMMYGEWATFTLDALVTNELPELTYTTQEWVKNMTDWSNEHTIAINEIRSKWHGSNAELCEELKKVHNKYIELVGTFLEARHHVLQARWKIYIDRMGQIASISPTHVGYLYAAIQGYFSYLHAISSQVNILSGLDQCNPIERPVEPEDIFSNRLFEIMCDRGIGGQLPFGMVKVNLSCEGIKFSGTVELLKFGMEKSFRSGTSTIWIGGGVEANFKDVFEVEATQKLFVVWDKNNVCTDAGMSGTGKLSVSNIQSTEFGYSFGVNSGFNAEFKTENDFANNVDKIMGFL